MSKVFIHKKSFFEMQNGKKVRHEEEIIDDAKVLKFKLFTQSDDKKEKFFGKLTNKDTWIYIHTVGDKKEEKEMSHADLLKTIKAIKDLDFVHKFLAKRKMEGGRKKSRKGTTKKRSRKGTKKGTKKRGTKKRRQSRSKKRTSKKGSKKRGSKKRGSKKRGSKKRGSKKRASKKGASKKRSRRSKKSRR